MRYLTSLFVLATSSVASLSWMSVTSAQPTVIIEPSGEGIWQNFLNLFKENEDRGRGRNRGSRPVIEGLCLVSPFGKVEIEDPETLVNVEIWHTEPLLIWEGGRLSIAGIREAGQIQLGWWGTAMNDEVSVWQLPYAGTPLEPGTQYEWLFFLGGIEEPNPEWPTKLVSFQIVDRERHDRITADLTNLKEELETNNADAEVIAIAHANYFLNNDLPADALQAVFDINIIEPSEELVAVRSELVEEICASE